MSSIMSGFSISGTQSNRLDRQEEDRKGKTYRHETFDFLDYTFRAQSSMTRKGTHFVNFSRAISAKAVQAIRTEVRSCKLQQCSDKAIEDLSRMFNPIVRDESEQILSTVYGASVSKA